MGRSLSHESSIPPNSSKNEVNAEVAKALPHEPQPRDAFSWWTTNPRSPVYSVRTLRRRI